MDLLIHLHLHRGAPLVAARFKSLPTETSRVQLASGESRSLEIPFVGVPRPQLVCSRGGQQLDLKQSRVRVELLERSARFAVSKADIADSGQYTLRLWNAHGDDQLDMQLTITGTIVIQSLHIDSHL